MFFFLNEFFPKMYFFFLLKLVTYLKSLGKRLHEVNGREKAGIGGSQKEH